MTRNNSTNSRALTALAARATHIAENLERSEDIERQHAFEATVTSGEEQLKNISGQEPDRITSRLSPISQSKCADIILNVDKALNDFEDPTPTHQQEMMQNVAHDERELAVNLEGLMNAGDGLLEDLSQPIDSSVQARYESSVKWVQSATPPSVSPYTSSSVDRSRPSTTSAQKESDLYCEQSMESGAESLNAYSQFVKRTVTMQERISPPPTITFCMSDMETGPEDEILITQVNLSYNHTFMDLSNIILDHDLNRPLPDFWLRKRNPEKNRVTPSGAWWEWQEPKVKVSVAIHQQQQDYVQASGVGLKSVVKRGEYVVLLVNKDERECEIPTEIPREERRKALHHFQQVLFPNESVARVLELDSGDDASDVVFDGNYFRHKTNPLFVEVRRGNLVADRGKGTPALDPPSSSQPTVDPLFSDRSITDPRFSGRATPDQQHITGPYRRQRSPVRQPTPYPSFGGQVTPNQRITDPYRGQPIHEATSSGHPGPYYSSQPTFDPRFGDQSITDPRFSGQPIFYQQHFTDPYGAQLFPVPQPTSYPSFSGQATPNRQPITGPYRGQPILEATSSCHPINSGIYTITNVYQKRFIYLEDANDKTPLRGHYNPENRSARWLVERRVDGEYSIKNVDYDRYASCGSRARLDAFVEGHSEEQVWRIQERYGGQYTIATIDNGNLWKLPDNTENTPVELFNVHSDRSCWWTFTMREIEAPADENLMA